MGPWPLPDNMGPLAEDNRTGICPERGIMAGKGITAKNKKNQAKQLLTSLLKVSPTKTRWYRLDGRFLSSSKMGTDPDDDAEPATSAISMTEVRIHKSTMFGSGKHGRFFIGSQQGPQMFIATGCWGWCARCQTSAPNQAIRI